MNISLVSNSQTWELQYKESEKIKLEPWIKISFLVLSILAWPALVIVTPLMIVNGMADSIKLSMRQTKFAKILKNENQLKEYVALREKTYERKVAKLKKKVAESIESHLRKNNQGPLGGKAKIEFLLNCIDLPPANEPIGNELPKKYWEKMDWEAYLDKDFHAISTKARGVDQTICKILHVFQLKYKMLIYQNEQLTNCTETEQLERVRRVAELSFVKYGIKKRDKVQLSDCLLWALPTGILWYLLQGDNDRIYFEHKKEHLKAVPTLEKYKDLIEAHNQLIKTYDYLIPYRAHYSTPYENVFTVKSG